ncbi:MAG TPA: extracellular solute-binding protein [Ilumatobacteraceae bacterium]|nr:extracellular solute-binding protein [Ilumatobacteraceae bacterium]
MTSKPRSRRLIRGLAALSALTLLAAACGDDDAADDAPASTDTADTTEPEAATTEPPTDTAGAVTDTTEVAAVTTEAAGTETSAPAGISEADWDAIVTAAQEEGKVTFYSSQGLDQLNDLAQRFSDEYGIELEVVRDIDSALIPKVEAEQQTGSGIADVIAQASASWSEQRGSEGWFVAPVGPAFDDPAYDRAANVSDNGYFTSSAAVLTFGWNTDQYPTGLTDYSDLLDPELAGGRIGVIEPAAPSIVDFWLYLEENYGEDFVTQLAAQEPKIYPSSLPMAQALTSGEISAGSFVQVLVDEKEQGAPVDSGLADQVWGARFNTSILEVAPHPNAAQVLANFIITEPGQEAIARKAASVLPDVAGTVTTVDKVRVQDLTILTEEFVAEYQAKWNDLFK